MTNMHGRARAAFLLQGAVVGILAAWVAWETMIAFESGVQHLPVFGWKVRGGPASGIEVLFACVGLSFGIMAIATVLVNRIFRDRAITE
jgi:hypothetical protein